MLMFDNGLLTSFIPEILMVLGYILCLIAPQFKTEETSGLNPVTIEVTTTTQHQQLSTYQIQAFDFSSICSTNKEENKNTCLNQEGFNYLFLPHQKFKISDKLTFRQFSRPPPFSYC